MIFVLILFGFLIHTVTTYKTDTFPPMDIVRKHYDIDRYVKVCYEKSGADKNELREFEESTDLKHLPKSHELKVFLRCFAEVSEAVDTESNRVNINKFFKYLNDVSQEDRIIYIKMTKGCINRAAKIADPLDYFYKILVCGKENDNEHFHIFY